MGQNFMGSVVSRNKFDGSMGCVLWIKATCF